MIIDKFFALAREAGVAQSQIQVIKGSSTKIRLFRGEVDEFKIKESQTIIACGIYDGKFGSAISEKLDEEALKTLVESIKRNASISEKPNEVGLFAGSPKYKKKNIYSAELHDTPIAEKIALLKRLESAIKGYDPRITDVDQVTYAESESDVAFYNSLGLKLKQKGNYFYFVAGAVAAENEETKTYYDEYFGTDIKAFNPEQLAKKICDKALAKFNWFTCRSGQYPTVLDRTVFASLLDYFLESTIADNVQRHTSFLEGKLNEKVGSTKLTIEDRPLEKTPFYTYFDDEGVATYNKTIVKNGKLLTYLYNRETAKKDGAETTANAAWHGGKIGTGYSSIYVKKGKQTFDELIAPIKEGVYITEIAGLGTGMNARSGNFSCQAEGYWIKDGKIDRPLNLITLSGNLLKLMQDIKGFDDRAALDSSSFCNADCLVKKLSIGGE